MAAFTNQFLRHDPLAFDGSGYFQVLAFSMAMDAREFISLGLSRSDLIAICERLDREIDSLFPDPLERRLTNRCEIDVLEAVLEDNPKFFADFAFEVPVHTTFALFAIWKLIDLCELGAGSTDGSKQAYLEEVNIAIASASTALQLAGIALGRLLSTMRALPIEVQAKQGLSEKRLRKRRAVRDKHRAFALNQAKHSKERSRISVAGCLVDEMRNRFGNDKDYLRDYQVDTVDEWLKKSGWKKTV